MNQFKVNFNYNIENIGLKMVKVECCKIDAKFKKENEVIYRRETKIFLNENNKDRCTGIVLMLNPGKCLPKGTKEIDGWQLFKDLECDNTQNNVANCVKEAYDNNPPQGYVYIVNLSDKRKTESKKLSEENFTKDDLEIVKEIENKIKEQEEKGNSMNWIWIAFGKIYEDNECPKKHKKRNELKKKVLNRLKEMFQDKIVGEKINYLHPYNFNFKNKYNDEKLEIIKDIKGKLENSQ